MLQKSTYLLLLLLFVLNGQIYSQNYYLSNISVEDGLPQSVVYSMMQDHNGYIWFSTQDGVSRYDGVEFTNISTSQGLVQNMARALMSDSRGFIWVGTDGGLSIIAPNQSIWNYTTKNGLPVSGIRSVLEDSDLNRVWIGTSGGGLAVYDDSERKISRFNLPGYNHITIYDMIFDSQGRLLLGTTEGLLRINKNGDVSVFDEHDGISSKVIRTLFMDDENNIWIGGYSTGISTLNPDDQITNYTKTHNLQTNRITSIVQDEEGIIWIGSEVSGVLQFQNNTFSTFDQEKGLYHVSIQSMLIDSENNHWFGTYGGGTYRLSYPFVTYYTNRHGLSDNNVTTVDISAEGNLWIGTNNNGINRFENNKFTHFTVKDGLPNNRIFTIHAVSDNRVWAGHDDGFTLLENGRMRHWNQSNGLRKPSVRAIYEDPTGGVWVGMFGGGVQYLKNNVLHDVPEARLDSVYVIYPDRDQNIWVGADGGIFVLNQQREVVGAFNKNNGLSDTRISEIFQDSRGRMWIGTFGGGFSIIDGDKITNIDNRDGLPNNLITFFIEDKEGRIWIGTKNGLSNYDGENFKNYTTRFGLPTDETNQRTGILSSDGDLWFGTVNGLTRFDLNRYATDYTAPKVYLNSIRIFDTDTTFISKLELPYYQNYLHFNFHAVHFTNPRAVNYRFRLTGLDEDWQYSQQRSVQYTSLPHGTYTFEVQASVNNRDWTEQPASLALIISPPFWRTNWFISLVTIAFGVVILLFIRTREELLKKRNQDLEFRITERTKELEQSKHAAEAANRAKSAFLAAMSHELRTPMNAILGFSQYLNKADDIPERYKEYINIMRKSGEHLLSMINDILDLSKIEAGRVELKKTAFDLHNLTKDIEAMFSIQAQEKGLGLTSEIVEEVPRYVIMDQHKLRQNLINLVGNAIKFTNKGEVHLKISVDEKVSEEKFILRYDVQDSGAGISEEDLKKIFAPFHQTDNVFRKGTGLGLTITERLCKLMNGSIEVHSEIGKGSVFTMHLPCAVSEETAEIIVTESGDKKVTGIQDGKNPRILIVDDVYENLELVNTVLSSVGFDCMKARDGFEAVSLNESFKPDAIVMDIVMPGMDGIEAMKEIRYKQDYKTPIIALTASGFDGRRDELIAMGFDEFIHKPFHDTELYNALARFTNISFIYSSNTSKKTGEKTIQLTETDGANNTQKNTQNLVAIINNLPKKDKEIISEASELMDFDSLVVWFENQPEELQDKLSGLHQILKTKNFRAMINLGEQLDSE